MRTITIDSIAQDFTAYDHALAFAANLAGLPEDATPGTDEAIHSMLEALSDKKLIALRNEIQQRVDSDEWGIASPGAYDSIRTLKSKEPTVVKRAAFRHWLDAEGTTLRDVWAQRRAKREAEAAPAPAPITAAEGVPVVIEVAASGKTKAERAPRDEFSTMSVEELQQVAKALFNGLETKISSKAELLRRIRRGRRQQAAGEAVRWAVPSPGAKAKRPAKAKLVRVQPHDVATVLRALREEGVGGQELSDAVSRLEDAILVKATGGDEAQG